MGFLSVDLRGAAEVDLGTPRGREGSAVLTMLPSRGICRITPHG
jgi:hypothetical protein